MLRFFRQIRQRFLTDNKFSKYLLYAVGEILLVVIGILIALQVDNWNEERIAAENTKVLFQEVSDELSQNIKNVDRIINLYIQKDSLYFKVLNRKVKHQDYRASEMLFYFPFNWDRTSLVEEDFKELLAKKRNLTGRQDSIFSELKDLYGTRKINTDKDDQMMQDTHLSFRDHMMYEQLWWSSHMTNFIVTDEMIQYCLTDPLYLNQLGEISLRERGHLEGMLWFRSKALDLYEKIAEMLKIEKDSALIKDIKDFEHIKGVYQFGELTLHISGETELKLNWFVNDSILYERNIHMFSNSYLISFGQEKLENNLLRIEKGKNGEVLGLTAVFDFRQDEDGNRVMGEKMQ